MLEKPQIDRQNARNSVKDTQTAPNWKVRAMFCYDVSWNPREPNRSLLRRDFKYPQCPAPLLHSKHQLVCSRIFPLCLAISISLCSQTIQSSDSRLYWCLAQAAMWLSMAWAKVIDRIRNMVEDCKNEHQSHPRSKSGQGRYRNPMHTISCEYSTLYSSQQPSVTPLPRQASATPIRERPSAPGDVEKVWRGPTFAPFECCSWGTG